jgi:hypothetical protein
MAEYLSADQLPNSSTPTFKPEENKDITTFLKGKGFTVDNHTF